LHPTPLATRVRSALDDVSEACRRAGGNAELAHVADDEVVVELVARRDARPALERIVSDALCAAAPDAHVVFAHEDPSLVPASHLVARSRAVRAEASRHERCDMCGAPIAVRHEHVVSPAESKLSCACTGCATLFESGGRWKRVTDRQERLASFAMSAAAWDALSIPIGVAFFVRSSVHARTLALCPGPAGLIEAPLPDEAWAALARDNPVLDTMAPDVEALLVNRTKGARAYYRVSIDHAYALTGLLRRTWRGLSGGAEAWQAIAQFFGSLEGEPRA
jgi:hypothetical protein